MSQFYLSLDFMFNHLILQEAVDSIGWMDGIFVVALNFRKKIES